MCVVTDTFSFSLLSLSLSLSFRPPTIAISRASFPPSSTQVPATDSFGEARQFAMLDEDSAAADAASEVSSAAVESEDSSPADASGVTPLVGTTPARVESAGEDSEEMDYGAMEQAAERLQQQHHARKARASMPSLERSVYCILRSSLCVPAGN